MIDVDVSEHKVATIDESGNMLYEHPKTKFEYELKRRSIRRPGIFNTSLQ
jgi:hypothetical protein